jgi:hypothetical protein
VYSLALPASRRWHAGPLSCGDNCVKLRIAYLGNRFGQRFLIAFRGGIVSIGMKRFRRELFSLISATSARSCIERQASALCSHCSSKSPQAGGRRDSNFSTRRRSTRIPSTTVENVLLAVCGAKVRMTIGRYRSAAVRIDPNEDHAAWLLGFYGFQPFQAGRYPHLTRSLVELAFCLGGAFQI